MVLGVLLLSAVAVQCHAQQVCGPRAEVLKKLADAYKETPVVLAIGGSGRILEIIASPNGETWTAITTGTDGVSCVVMTGEQLTILGRGRGA